MASTPQPHDCNQERRIDALEAKANDHADALTDGRIKFAEIQRDLAQIQTTLAEIKAQLAGKTADWLVTVRDAALTGATYAVMGGLLWAIVKSGASGVIK